MRPKSTILAVCLLLFTGSLVGASRGALATQTTPGASTGNKQARFDPIRRANTISSFNTGAGLGTMGAHSAIAIGNDGLPVISYHQTGLPGSGALAVGACHNVECTSISLNIVDAGPNNTGQYTSITIGADGVPLISYYDATAGALKVAHCSYADCSSATVTTVDSAGDVGQYTSITIGTDGLGLISYYDASFHKLKVAHCNNYACSSATLTTVNSLAGQDVGQYSSMVINSDGRGLIAYYNFTQGKVGMARCRNIACTNVDGSDIAYTTVEDDGRSISLVIGNDGRPIMSFYSAAEGKLKVMHCLNLSCNSPLTAFKIDESPGSYGEYGSIAIGADGLPVISYYYDGTLKLAHCYLPTCESVSGDSYAGESANFVDPGGANEVGRFPSMTIGVDGLPVISYYDSTAGDLKVLHCGNPLCINYQQNR